MIRLAAIALLFPVITSAQQIGIGQWRDHLSFNRVFAVEASKDKVFGASDQGIIELDLNDNSISKLTRVNGLNDFGITAIKYNPARSELIVGYLNGNIDLIRNGNVQNLPDIKRSSFIGDKTVNQIYLLNNTAYMACGFGIVVFDITKMEVTDTYKFGPNGTALKVSDIEIFNNRIYAATPLGLYSADRTSNFLANFESWTKESGFPTENNEFTQVELHGNMLYALSKAPLADRVLVNSGSGWTDAPGLTVVKYQSLKSVADRMIFTRDHEIYVIKDGSTTPESIVRPPGPGLTYNTTEATFARGTYYIAERTGGLLSTTNGSVFGSATPNGPLTNSVFRVYSESGYVYVATGSVDQVYVNGFRQDGIPYYDGSIWKTMDESTIDSLKNSADFLSVTIDPQKPDHAFVSSWNSGLIEVEAGKVKAIYNEFNSTIQEVPQLPGSYRVGASAFDAAGNLWVGNSFAPKNLLKKSPSGVWTAYGIEDYVSDPSISTISQVLVAQDNSKWLVYHRNGLVVFNESSNPVGRRLTSKAGEGGLPVDEVFCIAEDLDGEIWVGTSSGFGIIYSTSSVLSGGAVNAQQPIIEQDGNFEKILGTEVIKSIAVDGGNRKWMATQNSGVYLISEDGTKQILHFNTENSPLLSNEVLSVAINQKTGEVFFGTSLGVQSYLSDATGPATEIANVSVFPNPVRPGYEGPISIRGLVRETDVKITDVSGNIVFKTRSQGGQAIWDGLNFRGERCATGVYLVFCTNSDGSETGAGKIVFVK
ncbi:MAG: two-component regulator propeller domain-containing protein [Bacteroidota bacterium]